MIDSIETLEKPRTWYNSNNFPIIPVLRVTPATQYRTKNFSFNWLFLRLWTLDSLDLEFSIVCNAHFGIGFVGILPYLRWVLCIPVPESIQTWLQNNTWRNPKP